MEEQPKQQEETKIKKRGLIAVVQKFAGPEEERPVEFIEATTKHELRKKLADPGIAQVVGIIRGKKLEFKENRQVSF